MNNTYKIANNANKLNRIVLNNNIWVLIDCSHSVMGLIRRNIFKLNCDLFDGTALKQKSIGSVIVSKHDIDLFVMALINCNSSRKRSPPSETIVLHQMKLPILRSKVEVIQYNQTMIPFFYVKYMTTIY